jgi:putative chitinase
MPFNREVFFDMVRGRPFSGSLNQSQVDGMGFILMVWEDQYEEEYPDLRYLAYALATTKWETASTMQPIAEYGKGSGMSYGKPDPKTGETYYGRGFVQLTWSDNYKRADTELTLVDDESCYLHADNALDPEIAAAVMFEGMIQGWFRSPNTLGKWFNQDTNDAYMAREIINGDKNYEKPGGTVGSLIKADHEAFLAALQAAFFERPPLEIEVVEEPGEVVLLLRRIVELLEDIRRGSKT